MAAFGKFLRKIDGGYGHWCPGCETMHYIAVERPLANGARWSFDGNADAPTFGPSVRIRTPGSRADDIPPECCHYFLRAGKIEFCADSTHALAGKTVALPAWPHEEE